MSDPIPFSAGHKAGNGRFTLIRPLGRGGMGEVWLAQDERLAEPVALKFLPPEVRADASALDDLRRETAKSHKLTHPNIVRIHDFHEPEGEAAFISMEYVEGWTLTAVRVEQPSRVLSWEYLRPLVQQLCAALDYAHGERVIHRDLKPGNIMVDSRGRLKLADFGIAATVSDSVSRVSNRHATSGTLPYMSPQQVVGKRPQIADDIYALGATLYELLTSKPPFFTGDITHQVLHEPPESPDERLAALGVTREVPADVAAMVMACLAKDPAHRPQSARAVAEWIGLEAAAPAAGTGLSETLFSEPGEAPPDALPPQPAPQWSFWKVLAEKPTPGRSAVVLAVLALLIGSLFFVRRQILPAHRETPPLGLLATPPSSGPAGVTPRTLANNPPANQNVADAALPRGLVLHFSFDQPPRNGVVHDESGLGNDGEVGGVQWTPQGRHGGALRFTRFDSYIRVTNSESLNPGTMTAAVWIKTSYTDDAWRPIFAKNFRHGFGVSIAGDWKDWRPPTRNRGRVSFELNNILNQHWAPSDRSVADGQWHHVAATYDGTMQRLYIDGQLQRSPFKLNGVMGSNDFDLCIGGNAGPDRKPGEKITSFDGLMDEVMMFNRALSLEEVRFLHDFGLTSRTIKASNSPSDSRPGALAIRSEPDLASLKYGLHIHFGISTFAGYVGAKDLGRVPLERFAPTGLDVRGWARTAKEAGMTFAVLTVKHEAGFCLWPCRGYEYTIAASPVKTDILAAFIQACNAEGILPGVHYSIPDAHNEGAVRFRGPVEQAYFDVIKRHMTDLHSHYPQIALQVFDVANRLSPEQYGELCQIIKRLNPHCLVAYLGGKAPFGTQMSWATVNKGFFWSPKAQLNPPEQLYQAYRRARADGQPFLLNAGPDTAGRIPEADLAELMELKQMIGLGSATAHR